MRKKDICLQLPYMFLHRLPCYWKIENAPSNALLSNIFD